jgi:hypothetical protein
LLQDSEVIPQEFHLRGAREAAEAQCMRDYGLMAAFAGPLHKDLESETALQACVALHLIYFLLHFFLFFSLSTLPDPANSFLALNKLMTSAMGLISRRTDRALDHREQYAKLVYFHMTDLVYHFRVT